MRWIVTKSLRFRFIVVAVAVTMMVVGVGQLKNMPVDVFPEFAPPRVEVQTPALGLAPTDVEALITIPLEHALNGLPNLDVMRSKSVEQLSSIELIFKRGTDLMNARQLVAERLAVITPTLPTWAAPPVILQPLSATSRVMKIGLSSDELTTIDLSMLSYWKIRARLLGVPGVANVAIWGERIRMMTVQVEPDRLQQQQVSLDKVMTVTADALAAGILRFSPGAHIGTGGFIDTPNQRLQVEHVLPIVQPEDLGKVVVEERDTGPLLLGDVATLKEDHQALIGDAVINGGPGLMLIVEKLPWGNTLDVTSGVEAALDEMRPGLPGVDIDTTIFRPASFVDTAIDNLTSSLLLGSLLVVIVLVLFLFDWRAALISVITIPVSLTGAMLVLYWRGTTINTMILAGLIIALGAVVDDAIVDIENIVRRLRLARASGSGRSTASIILESSLEVRGAVVYASLIEALALLPIFFLTGLTGAFFRPLAFSYALAVIVSMSVALVLTPALSLILMSWGKLTYRTSPLVTWLQRGYGWTLERIVRRPLPAVGGALALLLAGMIVVPRLDQELLPDFKEHDFLMHWVTAPGTSLPEETRITTQASKELAAIPGVRNFGAHIGQALLADEVVGVDFGENWISVDPKANYDETVNKIRHVVEGYPGLRRDVQTYLKERTREVLAGSSDAIVVRVFGPDLDVLRAKAEEVRTILADIDGVIEEHVELIKDVPHLEVKVDLAAAQRFGVKPGDVRRAASTLVAGEEVGDIFRDGQAFDVQVWSTPATRDSTSDIEGLLLDTPSGSHVRLGDVASVAVVPTPNAIRREGASRRIDIDANVEGRSLGDVVDELEDQLAEVQFPREYHAELLGEYAERQAANDRLKGWAVVAAAGIFLLLVISFHSPRLAVLSFVTLPMALVGGALAVWGHGGIISLGSLVGFFTVLGIVARNGIMLISHYQHLEQVEGFAFGPGLVVRGAQERLAPILMTALTTGLALVPLVVTGNIPGQEIEYPMAIVILGGLVAATLLNLFIVPSLYLRFGRRRPRPAEPVPVPVGGGDVPPGAPKAATTPVDGAEDGGFSSQSAAVPDDPAG
jgi:CzcA family heavy metal efflux pump